MPKYGQRQPITCLSAMAVTPASSFKTDSSRDSLGSRFSMVRESLSGSDAGSVTGVFIIVL